MCANGVETVGIGLLSQGSCASRGESDASNLSQVNWWVGIDVCVCTVVVSPCYSCQFGKTPKYMKGWPFISLPLPRRPGQMVSFDFRRPLPRTAHGNEYVFLVVDLFAEGDALQKHQKNVNEFVEFLVKRL